MYNKKRPLHFYCYSAGGIKILLLCICQYINTGVSAQRTAEEKQSLCKQEKENLQKLEDKIRSLLSVSFYNLMIDGATKVKAAVLDFDIKTLDERMSRILDDIKALKEKTQNPLAYNEREGNLEEDKRQLKTAYAISDYLRQVRVKKEFGETVDLSDNPLQKEITLLTREKVNAEESRKFLLNDIRMNKERIRQLACPVSDKDEVTKNNDDDKTKPDTKDKNDNNSYDPKSVVGTWDWSFGKLGTTLVHHGTVTFTKDGKMTWSEGSHGSWTQEGQSVTLTWEDKDAKDIMTLSADGHNLSGKNEKAGLGVEGTRGTAKL